MPDAIGMAYGDRVHGGSRVDALLPRKVHHSGAADVNVESSEE